MIRLWEEKDLPILTALEEECFSDPWNEQALKSSFDLPFTHCFLAEEGGQVCGYCVLSVLFEDAEVLNIAVAPAYRKQGYGKLLMETMLEKAKVKPLFKRTLPLILSTNLYFFLPFSLRM